MRRVAVDAGFDGFGGARESGEGGAFVQDFEEEEEDGDADCGLWGWVGLLAGFFGECAVDLFFRGEEHLRQRRC